MSDRTWTVRLSAAAERDFVEILRDTVGKFGLRQAETYRDLLTQAIAHLADGPDVAGSRSRSALRKGLRSLHVARRGRHGRHFLLYRERKQTIEILRILHDAMDLRRHVPPEAQ